MRARTLLAAVIGLVTVAVSASPAYAGHHLWRFSQLFSNADASVQFIQLTVNEDNEQGVGPFTITAGANTFNFVTNLPGATTSVNKWILVATSNFAGLPGGVTPDYIIPASFFATGGGTLTYASGVDVWSYGKVPTDGHTALYKSGATVTTGINSPANFGLQSGSVSLPGALSVPGVPTAGIAVLVALLLLAGSGLLRRQRPPAL